ncbi:MAG: A/G-specific adenine glycosylase [Oscillospiraceae bacterium]|nr:A/G-specific adenine glycosylase [Oscillospiraceae bacterium]
MSVFEMLPGVLLPWYGENRRDLPWRQDREPYHIWLSEIMLQQTRVEAVKGYYTRFLGELPTIETLAAAEDELLHKLWEGLGYYSRVRNLKKAAQKIMERHGGVFPRRYEDILALPGIGAYTAGAISSIAFGQPRAAVDGNVLRVISRLTENDTPIDSPAYKKEVQAALEAVYPPEAGAFTQALMELGATLCGPNWKPKCEACPCRQFCGGAIHGTAERFPVKKPKAQRRIEERTVFVLCWDGRYGIEKRPPEGLLAGLWQFPNVAGRLELEAALQILEGMGLPPKAVHRQSERKHIFTHIEWRMRAFYLEVGEPGALVWMTPAEIEEKAALPTAFRQFWEEIENV